MSSSNFYLLRDSEKFHTLKFRNAYVVQLNGKLCTTSDDLYRQLKSHFEFPDYFGNNLDALYDCLMDLEWITQDHIVIYFENADLLLSGEVADPDFLEDFWGTLYDVCISWILGSEAMISSKLFSVYLSYSDKLKELFEANDIEFEIIN
ncbi:MAG: barstar family protein [Saprospiraceae bacterium]|nr:barstar family protein [Saprospiraceae bacterium]